MNKTLIASAITAATLSTGAFAMDNSHADKILGMIDGMPKISGDIEIYAAAIDSDAVQNTDGLQGGSSTIAVDHETAISEETTAYVHAEFDYDSTITGSGFGSDESYIGFKGEFGDISFGSNDSVYEKIDIIDFSENLGGLAGGDILGANESQTVNYSSPSIEDMLTIHVSAQTDEVNDNLGALVAAYSQDAITVNLGYGINDIAKDVIGLSGSFTMDDLTISAQYETQSKAKDLYGVLATYAMGENTFNFAVMMSSPDGATPAAAALAVSDGKVSDDVTSISASVVHSLAENVYVYAEASFQSSDDVDGERDHYVVGTAYSF